MKKVNLILVTLMFIINQKIYRTARSLTVINPINDESKTIGLGKPPKRKKARSIPFMFGGMKIIFAGNDRSGKGIYLMAAPNPNPVITATINAPDSAEGKALLAESIRDKGASTTYVTIPPGQLLALTPLIAALRAAVGVAAVDYAWDQLNTKLKLLMRIIQDEMDLLKPQSVIICVHYGYHPKGRGGSHAQIFGGESGAVAGSIDLIFPIGQDGCCYDIRLWNVARTTYTRALPSDVGHAHIDSLVSGEMQRVSVAEIRHGLLVRESQIIEVRAK